MENRMRAEKKQELASVSEIDDIVYRISHDLMASVRAIRDLPRWITEDLKASNIDLAEDAEKMMALLQSHSRRMDRMIAGLLTYSRVGRLQEIKVIETRDALPNAIAAVPCAEHANITSRIAPANIVMGETDFYRLVEILISNAVTHHPKKSPRIQVLSLLSRGFWELHVSDDGAGVPYHLRETIFQPMHKLVSRDEHEGGGMGLAIARKIVSRYGGTIEMVGNSGARSGSVFMVKLPCAAG